MPELPEVETVRRGLEIIKNKKITEIFRSNKKLRFDSTIDIKKIINSEIINIERKARYLIVNFSNNKTAIIHLGMSGRISIKDQFIKLKHDHFAFKINNQEWLIYNDPRRFGFIDLIKTDEIENHKMLAKLGPEPLSDNFNSNYLSKILSHKTINIKTAMMDNSIVVGVGNIYINESLFDSAISPLRSCKTLKKNEIEKLINSIKKIINEAIKLGGSSISDYQNTKGEFGYFQNLLKVYDRSNQDCYRCNGKIERIIQNGRSSFYCKSCQF